MTPWKAGCTSFTVGEYGELLTKRVTELTGWLKENAPECDIEQKHLDANTPERIYWHYGYLCALRDSVKLLSRKSCSEDISSRN